MGGFVGSRNQTKIKLKKICTKIKKKKRTNVVVLLKSMKN